MTDLSAILVNYHSDADVIAAIDSLRREAGALSLEVIVVDNDEDGAGGERIRRERPDVRLLSLRGNPGFAAGCNAGLSVARGRFALLINPDVRVGPGALERCVAALERAEAGGVAALGCEHRYGDGSLQLSSYPAVLWPGPLSALANAPLGPSLLRRLRPDLLEARSAAWKRALHERSHETDAVQGSFLFLRREVVRDVGPLDPDFFLYYEELDWCRRARSRGLRILYLKEASVVHETRRREGDDATERQAYLSEALFVLKRRGRAAALAFVLVRHLNVALGFAAYPLLGPAERRRLRTHARRLGFASPAWLRLLRYGRAPASGPGPLRAARPAARGGRRGGAAGDPAGAGGPEAGAARKRGGNVVPGG